MKKVLVVLVLVASVAAGSATTASTEAVLAGAAVAQRASSAGAESARPKIAISATALGDRLHVASVLQRRKGVAGFRALFEEKLLQGIYRRQPHAPSSKIVPLVRKLGLLAVPLSPAERKSATTRRLERSSADADPKSTETEVRDSAERWLTAIGSVVRAVPPSAYLAVFGAAIAPWVPLAVTVVEQAGKLMLHDMSQGSGENDPLLKLQDQYLPGDKALSDASGALTSREMARDPRYQQQFGPAWQGLYENGYGHELNASPAAIVTGSKEMLQLGKEMGFVDPVTGRVRAVIGNATNVVRLDIGELRDFTAAEFVKVHGQMNAISKEIVALDKLQREQYASFQAYIKDEETRQKKQKEAADEARAHQLSLDASKSAVYLLSTLIGFGNEKAGRTIAAAGNATIAIAESLNQWNKTIGGLGQAFANPAASLATLVMTGNVIGAVMSILPLLTGAPDSSTRIMLKLDELKNDIRNLGTRMDDRFDRVDRSLKDVYSQLATLGGDLGDLRLSLRTIERNMIELAADARRGDLWDQIDEGLGWRQKYLDQPVMPRGKFKPFASAFHSYANRAALSVAAIGVPDRLHDDPEDPLLIDVTAGRELRGFALEYNVNLLNEYSREALDAGSLWSGRLVNIRDWALGSRAYVSLSSEWPSYARGITRSWSNDLSAKGNHFRDATRALSTKKLFVERLFDRYDTRLAELDSKLAEIENTFYRDESQNRPPLTSEILWGGPERPLPPDLTPPVGPYKPCAQEEGDVVLPAPAGADAAAMLPAPVQLAHHLGLGKADICWAAGFVQKSVFGTGDLTVALVGRYQPGGDTSRFAVRVKQAVIDGVNLCVPSCQTAQSYTRLFWEILGLRARFERDAETRDAPTQEPVKAAVAAYLASKQRELYERVRVELNPTGGRLREAEEALDGVGAVIAAYLELGLPQAVATDEYLRSLVYGEQAIPDSQSVRLWLNGHANEPLVQARTELLTAAHARATALLGQILQYQKNIRTGKYREFHQLVESTLAELQLSRHLTYAPRPRK